MATTIARLQAVLSADTRDYDRGMDRSETRMQKTAKVAGVAGLAIAGGLAYGLKKSVDAAQEAEVSQAKMEAQLKALKIGYQGYEKQISSTIDRTSKLAAVDDEELQQAFTRLLPSTRNVGEALTQMSLAADISRAQNISLEAATKLVTRANTGSAGALRKIGITLPIVKDAQREVTREMEAYVAAHGPLDAAEKARFQQAMDKAKQQDREAQATANIAKLQETFAGAAEKYGNTAAGAQERASVAVENLQESLGSLLLPAVARVSNEFAHFAEFLTEHQRLTKAIIAVLGILSGVLIAIAVSTKLWAAATTIASAAVKVWTAAQWLLNAALTANPIALVILALVALGAAIIIAWQKSETFRNIVTGALGAIRTAGQAMANFFRDTVVPIFSTALTVLQHLPAWLLIKFLIQNIDTALDGIRTGLAWLRDKGGPAVAALWDVAKKPLDLIWSGFKKIGGVIDDIVDAIKWLGDHIGGILGAVGGAVGKVTGALGHVPGFGGGPADPGMTMPPGTSVGVAPNSTINSALWDELALARADGLVMSSGYRPGAITKHGTPSDHGTFPSKAIDVAGPSSAMAKFFTQLLGRPGIKQAFYDPLGSIFNGAWSSYREGGHSDHVHVATYDTGGWLQPGWTMAYNGTGRPEAVGGAGVNLTVNFPNYVGDRLQLVEWLRTALLEQQLIGRKVTL